MGNFYIREYESLGIPGEGGNAQIAKEPALLDQTPVSFGSAVQSAAFGPNTRFARFHTDSICSFLVGANPTATTNNARMAASQTEIVGVTPGHKVSIISNT